MNDIIILDPFMGGGTTLVEANRLGAKVIGCDINPVSFWIVRETLKPIALEKLDTYFRQLERTTKEIHAALSFAADALRADVVYPIAEAVA